MPPILRRSYPYLLLAGLSWHTAQAQTTPTSTQETFDTGTKPDYPAGSVALPTGPWTFTDALLGSDPADHKNGAQAARLEGSGRLTMEFYLPNGASTVTVQHAVYGTDASSSCGRSRSRATATSGRRWAPRCSAPAPRCRRRPSR